MHVEIWGNEDRVKKSRFKGEHVAEMNRINHVVL